MIKKITRIVILVGVLLWIGWDIFAFIKGHDATISIQIWGWSSRWPVIPFVSGFVCGHLFWQSKQ